jgi:hypothetical protein
MGGLKKPGPTLAGAGSFSTTSSGSCNPLGGALELNPAGDVVWIYMGPQDQQPPFPNFWWATVPSAHRVVGKIDYECNYVQSIEGAIEHIHGDVLHSGHQLMGWTDEQLRGLDREYYGFRPAARHYEFQDTAYGFRFGGIKPQDDEQKSVNVTPFIVPFHILLASSPHMFVPMDDEHTWYFDVRANSSRPIDRERALRERGEVFGVDVGRDRRKIRNLRNNFMQDRQAMREKKEHWSFSGIPWGKPHQDMAVIETMGALTNWGKEHLGVADNVIIAMRQCLVEAARHFVDTGEVPSWKPSVPLSQVRGGGALIPVDAPWQSVAAFAGEFEPALAR